MRLRNCLLTEMKGYKSAIIIRIKQYVNSGGGPIHVRVPIHALYGKPCLSVLNFHLILIVIYAPGAVFTKGLSQVLGLTFV